jgi:hypothetical protein
MICGGAIDENMSLSQKYCSNQKCKWKYLDHLRQLSRKSRERQRQEREALNQQARELRGREADAAGIENPEDFIATTVPANTRNIRDLPEKRRKMFCNRLKQLIEQAATEQHSPTHITDDSKKQTEPNVQTQDTELCSILKNACTICKGSCCTQGEEHAYIKVETLLRYMHQHPELQENQVLDNYLSFLPEKSYEDSCVYHTETGCSLPSYMRSDTCPRFVCNGLDEIEKHTVDTKSCRFFVAAMEGKNILRSAFIEGDQIRGLHVYF